MAKVLLIMPPWLRFLGEGLNEIPLGLCYLSSYLKQAGHETSVFNCDLAAGNSGGPEKIFFSYDKYKEEMELFRDPVWDRIRREVEDFKPDYVGIHVKTSALKSIEEIARIVRSVDPSIKIIAGGTHATLLPEETLMIPNIDYVVQGEGEETLAELIEMDKSSDFMVIPGLVYKNNGNIVQGGMREPVCDLDKLPFPDREDLVERDTYSSYGFGIIVTSRGCPFSCTYCAAKKIWQGKVRYRSTDNIIEEIKYVKEKYGTIYFNFRDDTFTLKKERAIEICERIINEKLNIVWRCDTRADSLSEELVRIMKRAGCVQASIGIESGSDRILELVKKGETTRELKEGISLLRKYRIPVSAFIMVGFPTETREEALKTLSFAKSLGVETLALSVVTPYPGTEIYKLFRDNGLIPDKTDYSDYYHQSPKMGQANIEGDDYKLFLDKCFHEVEEYNKSPYRLIRRFLIIFFNNPGGALERLFSYFYK